MASKKAVMGLLTNVTHAETVLAELQRAGFARDDVSALFSNENLTRDFAHEKHTKAPEGAVAGGSAGGAIGGTLGLLVGMGSLAIPGVGPLIAAGPIMAALSGAAAGAMVGGVAGALIGLGIPEIEAKQYEAKLKEGRVLISIHVEGSDERKRAKKVLEAQGASHIATVGESSVPSSRKEDNSIPSSHLGSGGVDSTAPLRPRPRA